MYEIILVVTMTISGQDFLDRSVQPDIVTCFTEARQRWDRFVAIAQQHDGEHDVTGFGAGCVYSPPKKEEEKG